jgi:hypothetical protein
MYNTYQNPGVYNPMYGTPTMPAMYGQPNQAQPVTMTNFLTPEQQAELRRSGPVFQTKLNVDEYHRAICTHNDGQHITLPFNNNGERHCTICSADFYLYPTDTPDEEIELIIKRYHDLLQTIKTYFLNAPEAMKDIYMIIGFVNKTKYLWQTAKKIFEQAQMNNQFGIQNNNVEQNAFAAIGSIFGTGFGGYGAPAPAPNYYAANQGYNMQPQYGAPMTPPPAAPSAPVGGYNPAMNVNPGYAMPPAPPTAGTPQYGAPAGYPSPNPIGYVDPNSTPTQTQNVQLPIAGGAATPAPAAPVTPPTPPAAPVNPNIKEPAQAAVVDKQFS